MTEVRVQSEGEKSPGRNGVAVRHNRSVSAEVCQEVASSSSAEALQEEQKLKQEGANLLELTSCRSMVRQPLERHSQRVKALLGWLQ